ncbi:HEAT repeat domain-containing protein [Ekhidna sp.]|uniref:HEAT repeat domain-containing protein n=1 Tax=Ekhidna sp. TaxID=2608089 RepID=UPI003299B259
MKVEITDEQMIGLLEGEVNTELESKINSDTNLKKRFDELQEIMQAIDTSTDLEVPMNISIGFQQALINEKIKSSSGQWSWMQIAAAAALLIVGFGMGTFSSSDSSQELALLKDEIQSLREVTLTSRLQRHSASERIMAVNQIEERSTLNEELVATLIATLNSDESPNVRYASLQALEKFIGNVEVRAELVKSLESQVDPLIQISLITILVDAEERSAIAPLRDMIEKEDTSPEVKQQAEVAIQVLT